MPRTPMPPRIYRRGALSVIGLALVASSVSPARALAQPWDEATVVRLAAERAPEIRIAMARAELATAAVGSEGLLPNPEIGWERQEAFAPNAQAQDVLVARVPLDLSGRPAARRALAEVDAAFAHAEAGAARLDAIAHVLDAFYRAVATERRATLLEEAQTTLDEAARVMERRRAAGAASGYAASRLTLEAELARSRLTQARVDVRAAREALGALLDAADLPELAGDLEVASPGAVGEWIARAGGRPDLEALTRAESAASRASSAADFAWVPRLSLEAGYNRQDGPVVGHGYAVGVGIEIPLFDHGQGERARAAAARSAVAELRAATERRASARIRGAHARLSALLAERERFASATAEAGELLLRAAERGYREGELSLLELLDARRAVLEGATRQLALDLAARRADVRLRTASGALR